MSVFKCKMCGGDLEITQGMSVCECQYCGSKQTLPKISDEKKKNLYDRAGHFRRNNEYDKAMAIYEQILNEDAEDAESYWSIVLCRYGIEYVEDPATHRRVPTVNRAQLTSIFADENYKSALKYADSEQRAVYEAEAKEIEQIQKGILAISSKEEPFDVFICYKESDASGRRTPDSVLANDLYHQLTQEGFKVFFARITLEDKLGSAYEPYIFAALNSAKVMVVLGTKPEYFTAVWVKNEWSRFLAQIKSGANKALIPAYKDMDPYDLPEEFSHLQAQDMSKLGFMQDLIRGIKKITGQDKAVEAVRPVETVPVAGNGAQALVDRAFLFLEDGDFARADELCEQALNQDPKNSKAYVGKLMVERKLQKQEDLSAGTEELTENNYFQKALRFAEDGLKKELERCNQMIMDRNKDFTYEEALKMVKENGVQGGIQAAVQVLESAIGKYESLLGWRDSEAQIESCKSKKATLINQLYENTQGIIDKHNSKKIDSKTMITAMNQAIENLEYLGDYQDSKALLKACREKKAIYAKKLLKETGRKIRRVAVFAGMLVLIVGAIIFVPKAIKKSKYDKAVDYMRDDEYKKAQEMFEKLEDYADSEEYMNKCILEQAKDCMEKYEYEKACSLFKKIDKDYYDVDEYIDECESLIEYEKYCKEQYASAMQYKEDGAYENAIGILTELGAYKDSAEQITKCEELIAEGKYQEALGYKKNKEYTNAIAVFAGIKDYKDSAEQITKCEELITEGKYQEALGYKNNKEYANAIVAFTIIKDYKDSAKQIEECEELSKDLKYQAALLRKNAKEYDVAIEIFTGIKDYKDSVAQIEECKELIVESRYELALSFKNDKSYVVAISVFEEIKDYKDSAAQIEECTVLMNYNKAMMYKDNGEYMLAKQIFETLNYSDSAEQAEECHELYQKSIFEKAQQLYESGKYKQVMTLCDDISEYPGSTELRKKAYRCYVETCSVAISTGSEQTFGINSNGTTVATKKSFGSYFLGGLENVIAVSTKNTCVIYLKSDGTVVAENLGNILYNVEAWKDIVAVSAGYTHVVGLKSDGTVVATGKNNAGQCNVEDWKDIVNISAGSDFTVGLKKGGTVVIAGSFAASLVENWTDIISVSAGQDHIVGLKSDGTVVVAGTDSDGRCNVSAWRNIVAISAGTYHTVGLKADGTVISTGWKSHLFNKVEDWDDVIAISAGANCTVGLKANGTVVSAGGSYGVDGYYGKQVDRWGGIRPATEGVIHKVK